MPIQLLASPTPGYDQRAFVPSALVVLDGLRRNRPFAVFNPRTSGTVKHKPRSCDGIRDTLWIVAVNCNAHLEKQQVKVVMLTEWLHQRLGAKSVMLRVDENVPQMSWDISPQVVRDSVILPVEEEVEDQDEDGGEERTLSLVLLWSLLEKGSGTRGQILRRSATACDKAAFSPGMST